VTYKVVKCDRLTIDNETTSRPVQLSVAAGTNRSQLHFSNIFSFFWQKRVRPGLLCQDAAYALECAGRDGDGEAAVSRLDAVKTELEKVMTFLSRTDWMDVAKREKIITDDTLNARMARR